MRLEGKIVWLVGASTGIGAALRAELTDRGATVAATSRSLDASPNNYPGDVCNPAQMKAIAFAIEESAGPIDIVISNAGMHEETWPERFDTAQYRSIVETNLFGMFNVFDAVLPGMLKRGKGTLAGVASLAGYRGLPRSAAYGASKAAMIHFMESIRFHLRLKGLRVVIVNPGFVRTPMTAKNDFYMPFLLDPPRAARYICDGLEREQDKIAFPGIFAAFLECARIIPFGLYNFLVDRIWRLMKYR